MIAGHEVFTREHTSVFAHFLNLRFFSGFFCGFLSGLLLGFLIAVFFDGFSVYRKLGTDEFAQTAGHAVFLLHSDGRMVALLVEFLREFENVLGTVLHTKRAPFAEFLKNVDLTARRFDGV
jgi:hypothetical protein